MTRKRKPFLKGAWDIISLAIIPMRRKRKHSDQKLLFKNRRLKLLRHYNYAFIGEYEFSHSSTPPFHHPRPLFKKTNRILSFLLCGSSSVNAERIHEDEEEMLGNAVLLYGEATAGDDRLDKDDIEVMSIAVTEDEFKMEQLDEAELTDEEDESVDGRAHRFIEKFYEEMRIQRQESIMHYRETLIKSCI